MGQLPAPSEGPARLGCRNGTGSGPPLKEMPAQECLLRDGSSLTRLTQPFPLTLPLSTRSGFLVDKGAGCSRCLRVFTPWGCLAHLQRWIELRLSLNTIVRLSCTPRCFMPSFPSLPHFCSLTSHFLSSMAYFYFISFPTAVSFQFRDPGSHEEFRAGALCREDMAMAWLHVDLGL